MQQVKPLCLYNEKNPCAIISPTDGKSSLTAMAATTSSGDITDCSPTEIEELIKEVRLHLTSNYSLLPLTSFLLSSVTDALHCSAFVPVFFFMTHAHPLQLIFMTTGALLTTPFCVVVFCRKKAVASRPVQSIGPKAALMVMGSFLPAH